MIYDRISHAEMYLNNHLRLTQAFQFIKQCPAGQAAGRYDLQGNDMYAMVADYETAPAETRRFEGHRRYIDVQVLLDGQERIDVSVSDELAINEAYHEEKDAIFFDAPEDYSSLVLRPGCFALFFPQDIHRPGVCLSNPQKVRKLVVKVLF